MKVFAQDVLGFVYAAAWMGIVMAFALPLVAAGAVITMFSVCFLFWYVVFCITWWTTKRVIRRVWHVLHLPLSSQKRLSRCHSRELLYYFDFKVASPPQHHVDESNYSATTTLKKTDSLQSFVGTGLDRDFEGTGGWASAQDDDALWMARPWDSEDFSNMHRPETGRSLSPSTRRSSMSIAPDLRTPSKPPDGVLRSDAYFPSSLVTSTPRSRRQSLHRRNNLSTTSFSAIKDEDA